ncbi:MAG: UTP--glucose-1-phosphate uridylyltransferase [Spirochaetia bacterium]|jgi:hypothetical protein|nr:UTP--glucose-1-phosphate uridylyltransferase [Spirochaetia bacterium]
MIDDLGISQALRDDMISKGIDIHLTKTILADINAGMHDTRLGVDVDGVPLVDGVSIVPAGSSMSYRISQRVARQRLSDFGLTLSPELPMEGGMVVFDRPALEDIGERLYSLTAWGVLNGGSATSYADRKKNGALGPDVFLALKDGFELLAPLCEGRPKGVTPAYINPDGSPGESFLLLKMRAALLRADRYIQRLGKPPRPLLPFFQMTSEVTDAPLKQAYADYANHPWLATLIASTGSDPTKPLTAKQPLLAAFTHSQDGMPRRVFDRAYGKPDSAIALPGGHGQGFRVLADVYRTLLSLGYRYAYLGNVDNVGYYPDAAEIAIMALSGAEAAFDFSYRTPVDIKGGVLVNSRDGRRTVADIGQAISFERVLALESEGSRVLFNCATGIFDLTRLVPRLDEIARHLPIRVSDQDKDAGRYSQAEQTTWEVIGLIDAPLGFAVEKGDRFIAAKLLTETLLASSQGGELVSSLPEGVALTTTMMAKGLRGVLSDVCGLRIVDGVWSPR